MDALHQHDYNVVNAIKNLVSGGGPVLCRDEMEEWSASEANLFEEALDKYGKSFIEIGQDFVSVTTGTTLSRLSCKLAVKQVQCFHVVGWKKRKGIWPTKYSADTALPCVRWLWLPVLYGTVR